jgi:hypothetical protein
LEVFPTGLLKATASVNELPERQNIAIVDGFLFAHDTEATLSRSSENDGRSGIKITSGRHKDLSQARIGFIEFEEKI